MYQLSAADAFAASLLHSVERLGGDLSDFRQLAFINSVAKHWNYRHDEDVATQMARIDSVEFPYAPRDKLARLNVEMASGSDCRAMMVGLRNAFAHDKQLPHDRKVKIMNSVREELEWVRGRVEALGIDAVLRDSGGVQ